MRVLVMVLLLVGSGAEAAPQFVGDVSLSVGAGRWTDSFEPHSLLSLDGGIKITPDLAVIAHGSVTSPHVYTYYEACDDPMPGEILNNYSFHWVAIEAGVGIDYAPTDAVWISPWIGMLKLAELDAWFSQLGRSAQQAAKPVYGLTGGLDVAADDAGNRLSVVANVSYSRLGYDLSYVDLTLGLAYRFW